MNNIDPLSAFILGLLVPFAWWVAKRGLEGAKK